MKRGRVLRKSVLSKVDFSSILPVRKPLPSGLYGTSPMPSSSRVGITSASGFSPPQRVLALEGGDRLDGVGPTDRLHARLGEAEVLDLAFLNQLLHRPRHVLDGHVRVDAMLIEQVDGLDLEPLERALDDLLDVLRPAVQARLPRPLVVSAEVEPELGGDDHLPAEGGEGLAHQLLVRERAVDLGGVEERDAAFDGRPEQRSHLLSTVRQGARTEALSHVSCYWVCHIDGHHQDTEVGTMPYQWPEDTDFADWDLDVLDPCPACGRMMHICDHRYRRLHTLEGPVQLICKLNHCPDRSCPGHAKTKSPEEEIFIAPPNWAIGWDVFCWIGHRRCSATCRSPASGPRLEDSYAIKLSDDAIENYIQRYQVMLAAAADPESLRRAYASVTEIVLSIDGLQPEKGHEALMWCGN